MCFLTVLLLLLISTFTYSMNTLVQTAPQEETLDEHERELQDRGIQSDPVMDNLIPFIHPYTDETKKFLKRMTRQFYITIPGKLKLVISCLKSSLKPKDDYNCITMQTSSPPGYRLISDVTCKIRCIGKNRMYVKFLNKNISKLLRTLFSEQLFYRLKLNTIDSDTGICVDQSNKKTFECSCKTNYQITMSSSLTAAVLDSIERISNNNETITQKEYVSALIVILKFYPLITPLFLAYLFEKYFLVSEMPEFEISDFAGLNINRNLSIQAVPEIIEGKVEYREELLIPKQKELFQIIFDKISSTNSCDLGTIADRYLDKNEILTWIGAFCIIALLFIMSKGADLYFLQ